MVLNTTEVAALMGVQRQTVSMWARKGMYGARRFGGQWRFHIYHLPLDPISREEYRKARLKAGKP